MRGINLSNHSATPIYQQLFEQISSQILKGELPGDFALPPIRTAAKELRVSIITVKKAWEELERAQLIYSIVGKGCFVSELSEDERSKKRRAVVRAQLALDLRFYTSLGVTEDEYVDMVREQYNRMP